MAVITIREHSKTDTGFEATLAIAGNNYQITVQDPFAAKQEQELEWYFEEWLSYPILDNVKAERAKASVKKYGEELFKQVFQSDFKAYSQYSPLKSNLNQLKIEIESITPEFHSIHWEALKDPDLPRPFAVDCIFSRKSVTPAAIEARVDESPTINLLVVTARPNGDRDVAYRTISRPLVEAIRNSRLRVKIDLLRPGTYKALSKHLEAKDSGYYHIVHFDVHGALITHKDYLQHLNNQEKEHQQTIKENPYIYDERYGRYKEIKPYEGVKAFLALEGNKKGQADLVEATEIADLLTGKGIPVCILNACQSGKQLKQTVAEDNRETSLGSRLMNAGMKMVVAMSYSVTVTAAEIMMQQIYEHLFAKKDLNEAIRLGRKELYNRKGRKAYYNTEIELEDWLLPVIYCNGKVDFNLRKFTPEEEAQYYLSLERKYEFPQPTYGFVGRDIDILLIEKALLQHNILLLQGMGGTGKTTLLNYLREWWQVTNFAAEIFYFGYDEKAYTLQQIVYEIGKQVYNHFEFATFQAQNLTVQWRKLADKLRAESYILILDNLESVTGQPLAIQNTLDEPAREEIKKFLASLVDGHTKIILGSRIRETWLQESTFRDNIHELGGLDAQARTDLAENILQRVNSSFSLEELKTDNHFKRLMSLLAGYPLAMEVVLSNLKNQSPAEILEQLEKAEIAPGEEDKTNNIIKCIEYSHSNLSESAQKLLLLLAPFRGFIDRSDLKHYAEQLGKLEPFQDYELEQLEAAVTEAVNWGLLSPISQDLPQLLTIQPVLPYFLQTKLKQAPEAIREALREGFKNHYKGLASYYDRLMESKEAQERRLGIVFVRWEYENLYQGLQICLEQQESVLAILSCLNDYLEFINDRVAQLQFLQFTYNSLSNYVLEKHNQEWETEIIGVLDSIAKCYLLNKDYKTAKETYDRTLEQIQQLQQIKPRLKQSLLAGTLHQLGRVAEELRQWEQAGDYYQQALDIYIDYGDRYEQADTLHNLGYVAQELRQLKQAGDYYQQALEIKIEYGDRFSQASTLHQLGYVAQELRQYQQARDYYQQALDIKIEYGDRFSQASTYGQLGSVAQELRQFQQAQDYYQQALDIYIEQGDRFYQAHILNHLGYVAQKLRQFQQAQDYYQQALEIFIDYSDRFSQACTLHNLGGMAQELSQFQQAENYFQQALAIKIEQGEHYEQASTYSQLGIVAQKLRQFQQAGDYYQQALEIYIDYGDRFSQATTYGQLGMLAEELLEFEQAKSYYLQALGIFAEFNDEGYLGLVISKLAGLYQKTGDNSLLTEVAAMFDMTEAEVRELFKKLTTDNG